MAQERSAGSSAIYEGDATASIPPKEISWEKFDRLAVGGDTDRISRQHE